MKKLILAITGLALIACTMISRAAATRQDIATSDSEDSTVDIVAYFNNHDTLDYWINSSRFQFTAKDTVKTGGMMSKVRIVVTDSTAKGYKMEYTILEIKADTTIKSEENNFMSHFMDTMGKKLVGTTIKFDTDETGNITKYTNLSQIKKLAKTYFKDLLTEMSNMEQIKQLKASGVDIIPKLEKMFDTDKLVEDFTKEPEMLFMCYGKAYPAGSSEFHDAATEESYECTTYMNAFTDPETDCNTVEIDVVNNIPKEDLIAATTGIMEFFTGIETQNIIAQMPDMPDDYTGTIDSYYSAEFLPNGWPNRVVDQTINLVGRIGRGKQTIIFLDYYNLIKD